MTITAIREKLHDYINEADDKQIEAFYNIFQEQVTHEVDWSEDKEFVAELDDRVRRWEEGIDRSYSWEETEAAIEELKKSRAAK